jgi:uncharacterized protein (DUF983 family)
MDGIDRRDWRQAAFRGFLGRCPRCAAAPLFAGKLRVQPHCPACGQDWSHQRADDFPSYIVILVLGHVLVPLMVAANMAWDWPMGLQMIAWPVLAALLAVALIRPTKGAVIGAQWAMRMGGFGTA